MVLKTTPVVTVKLKADPQAKDPAGSSSRFVGKHEIFAKKMDFKGTISGKVDGKERISEEFEEKDHEHKK